MANQNRMNGLRMRPLMKIRIGRSAGAEREAWELNPVVHIDIPEHMVVRKLEIQESERIACAVYEAGVRFLVWGPTVAAFHLRREAPFQYLRKEPTFHATWIRPIAIKYQLVASISPDFSSRSSAVRSPSDSHLQPPTPHL